MSRSITEEAMVIAPLLRETQTVREGVELLAGQELPALPVVDERGKFLGIFGEREFIAALFPKYLGQLKSAAFVRHSLDDALEIRRGCGQELIADHMNDEHVEAPADVSDVALAETFLHHRVLIIPVVKDGEPVGIVRRSAFFRALAQRMLERTE